MYLIRCFPENMTPVELPTRHITDQDGIYETIIIDEKGEETFSEINSPSTTDITNSQSKVEGFTLNQCPAYVPVNIPSAARGEEDVEDEMNGVYETVN